VNSNYLECVVRQDAKSLLKRLNLDDFQYRDFSDPFLTIEPWPLFQALLRDPRVLGRAVMRAPTEAADIAQRPAPKSAPERSRIFEAYEKRVEAAPAPQGTVNVRDFLAGLSGHGA
jgi:hypothetical protein